MTYVLMPNYCPDGKSKEKAVEKLEEEGYVIDRIQQFEEDCVILYRERTKSEKKK